MNTIENNKIIAEFIQPNTKHDNFYFPQFKEPYIYQGNLNGYSEVFGVDDLKYHSDWNWLMEVVEKIESLHVANNVFIASNTIIHIHNKYTNELDVFIGKQQFANVAENKKENTYNACLEFIKYYNEQNPAKEN